MNAIDLLKQQHKKTKSALLMGCEGKLDARQAKKAADELVAHMAIEEHIFYPRVRQLMKDMVAESFEEHTVARFALARCLMARGEEEMMIRFAVLKELVEHHIEDEEAEMLPKVQRGIPADELNRLGARMEAMFERGVEMGLDSLVTGPAQDLRSVDGGEHRSLRIRSPGRQIRAAGPGRATGRASTQRRAMR